jgi:hypothetical protein
MNRQPNVGLEATRSGRGTAWDPVSISTGSIGGVCLAPSRGPQHCYLVVMHKRLTELVRLTERVRTSPVMTAAAKLVGRAVEPSLVL